MIFLFLTIALTTALIIAFKVFDRLGIDTPTAIVANYWTCVVCGSLASSGFPVSAASLQKSWALPALGLGALFFALFNLIGWCTIRAGVAATSVANKLSMIIPVAASVWLYDEGLSVGKIAGIVLALPAVYLSTRVCDAGDAADAKAAPGLMLLGLAVVFVGSGMADSIVKWTETTHLKNPAEHPAYLVHVFLAAACLGTLTLVVRWVRSQRTSRLREQAPPTPRIDAKSVAGGIALGIPNYFSIFTLIRLLQQTDFLQSSTAIPVVNIGVVVVSTLAAVVFFSEKLSRTRLIGLVLAVAALLLIALSDRHG